MDINLLLLILSFGSGDIQYISAQIALSEWILFFLIFAP